MEYRRRILLPFLVVLVSIFCPLRAQITSTIHGVVKDSKGGVLPGVTVTAQSPDLKRGRATTVTDDSGQYRIAGLQPGSYQVKAVLSGFATALLKGINVPLNTDVMVNVTMKVAAVQQEITVEARPTVMRTDQSDLKELISTTTVDSIPLNGRQFLDLLKLTPGTAPRPPSSQQGADVTVFGERSITNSFLINGMDNNDLLNRNFAEFFVQDAIQEFQVLTGGYKAEFGRASGAVTNVVTRSGTDSFHGRAFGFFRNNALDSSNISGQEPAALSRQEVGGTLGGPIIKDRSFFFDAFEFFREKRGNNFDLSQIPQIVKDGYFSPAAQGENFNIPPLHTRYSNFIRLDHKFNDSNQLFASINLNRGDQDNLVPNAEETASGPPPGTIALPSTANNQSLNTTSAGLRYTTFFGPESILESSFRFSRVTFGQNLDKPQGAEAVAALTFSPQFNIFVSNSSGTVTDRTQDKFQWKEDVSFFKDTSHFGSHSIKFGSDMLRGYLDNYSPPAVGVIIGNTIQTNRYKELGYDVPIQRFSSPIVSPNDHSIATNYLWGFYAEDSWQVHPQLTLNLGLRFDYSSLFSDDKNNFAPRLGFAWNLDRAGDTVIRGGWGRFYDETVMDTVLNTPALGGIQQATLDLQVIPRGASFYNNPAVGAFGPLQVSGTRWLSNPLFYSYILPEGQALQSGGCSITGKGQPYIVYQLLGIPVADPANPPVLTANSVGQLTGGKLNAQQATQILNNFFGPQAVASQLPGCIPPAGPQFGFLDETGPNSVNSGQPLIFKFRQLSPEVDTVQTIQHPEKTPHTDSFNIGIQRSLGKDMSIEFQYFIRRSRDLLARRVSNLLETPIAASCAGNTTDGKPCNEELEYIGFLDSNALTVYLKKRFSHGYSFSASYTYTDATDNFSTLRVPPIGGETSFLFSNHPELDIGRSLNTPMHVFVFNGVYHLPLGIRLSGVLNASSGRPFNAAGLPLDSDGDNIFDNRLIGTKKGGFETAPFFNIDMRVAKQFSLGERVRSTLLAEFFNLTNQANPDEVNKLCQDTTGDGLPDLAGCGGPDFGATVRPFPGREIQFGFRLDF